MNQATTPANQDTLNDNVAVLPQFQQCDSCKLSKDVSRFYADNFKICKTCWAEYLQGANTLQASA